MSPGMVMDRGDHKKDCKNRDIAGDLIQDQNLYLIDKGDSGPSISYFAAFRGP